MTELFSPNLLTKEERNLQLKLGHAWTVAFNMEKAAKAAGNDTEAEIFSELASTINRAELKLIKVKEIRGFTELNRELNAGQPDLMNLVQKQIDSYEEGKAAGADQK